MLISKDKIAGEQQKQEIKAPERNVEDKDADTCKNVNKVNNTSSDESNINTNKKQELNPGQEHNDFDEVFKNDVFIGDSITEGIISYGLVDDSKVIANKGFTALKAQNEVTGLKGSAPQKIFILLGINDVLYDMTSEQFIENYIQVVNKLKSEAPNAQIYIQSIFPVSNKAENKKPRLSNFRIDEFNSALKQMASEQGVYFIDVASLFKDDSGCMREECTFDGIHLKYKYYISWLDYLSSLASSKI